MMDGVFFSIAEDVLKAVSCESKDQKAACTMGDMLEALDDEVIDLPLSNKAGQSLVAIMIRAT